MTNTIPNRQIICEVLMEQAKHDRNVVVLCSDSRGSASLTPFAEAFPEQFVEVGIAEQNLVGIAAGMAKAGKKAFAASPACFLSTRSYEQAKVDVAYSNTNVKLLGISGGISYGALGMSHHSLQDVAAMCAIPNMRVYIPSDRFLTRALMRELVSDTKPAYIRVGRNAAEDIYADAADDKGTIPFVMDRANVLMEGTDLAIIACGEMVAAACKAAQELRKRNISASVVDMYCLKPMDEETLRRIASKARAVITVEEHSRYGGLGAMVSQVVAADCPRTVVNLALPDEPVISGSPAQVFDYYGLNAEGIVKEAKRLLGAESPGKRGVDRT